MVRFILCSRWTVDIGISLYWDWRYTRIGKELHSANPALHPKKADVIRLLWQRD
ncbi:DUF3611 family protein [Fischerella thermalis]|uniref:DUF3611 family protein n=1 Tax=Fischerella thermalis TaxID=372787 RepID=UPI0034D78DD2